MRIRISLQLSCPVQSKRNSKFAFGVAAYPRQKRHRGSESKPLCRMSLVEKTALVGGEVVDGLDPGIGLQTF